jgi:hypothetical protein
MRFMRGMSQILMLIAVGLFFYDLVAEWIVAAHFKIRTVEELGKDISVGLYEQIHVVFERIIPPSAWNAFAHIPAPAFIAILGMLFYGIYRFMFYLSGESRGSRL